MKVQDEQFKVDGFTNPNDIIESFVEHTPIDKWVEQFTWEELELMQDHLSYNDAVECYNAIQNRMSDLKREIDLEAVKQVDWSDVATMIHPSGLEMALISIKSKKPIGSLLSFDGDSYRLSLYGEGYTFD